MTDGTGKTTRIEGLDKMWPDELARDALGPGWGDEIKLIKDSRETHTVDVNGIQVEVTDTIKFAVLDKKTLPDPRHDKHQ